MQYKNSGVACSVLALNQIRSSIEAEGGISVSNRVWKYWDVEAWSLSLSERDNPHLILPCRPLSFLRWGTICCSQTSRHAVRKRVKETGRQKDMMIQLPWGFTEHQSALPLASLQIYKRVFWKKNKDCKYRKDMKDHAFEPSDQISGAKPVQ